MTAEEQNLLSELSLSSNLESAFDQMNQGAQKNLLNQAGIAVKKAQN